MRPTRGNLLGGKRPEFPGLPGLTRTSTAGAEPGLTEESPAFGATVEEPLEGAHPRLGWAGLLKRTFALDVFACLT